jgi:AraC-like DNA-binding protein
LTLGTKTYLFATRANIGGERRFVHPRDNMAALIRAASLTNYAEVARRAGLNPALMVRSAGLPAAALSNPDLRVAVALVGDLLERSAEESQCLTIGLQMAESRRLSDFGALSLLLSHQRTLREVLRTMIEYLHVLNESLAICIENADDLVIVREEIVAAGGRSTRQATELAVGVLFRMFRTQLGPLWRPHSVNFAHPAPPELSVHGRVFGLTPTFDSEFSGIVSHARDLDRDNPGADPVMARYAKQFVEAMEGASSRSLAQEVKKAIYLSLPLGRATLEQIAAGLGINARTLQRQLDQSGETFSELVNGVRRDLVVRYMKDTSRSLTQIGEMLGFSHPSAFSRWYSVQFGKAPARARRQPN